MLSLLTVDCWHRTLYEYGHKERLNLPTGKLVRTCTCTPTAAHNPARLIHSRSDNYYHQLLITDSIVLLIDLFSVCFFVIVHFSSYCITDVVRLYVCVYTIIIIGCDVRVTIVQYVPCVSHPHTHPTLPTRHEWGIRIHWYMLPYFYCTSLMIY